MERIKRRGIVITFAFQFKLSKLFSFASYLRHDLCEKSFIILWVLTVRLYIGKDEILSNSLNFSVMLWQLCLPRWIKYWLCWLKTGQAGSDPHTTGSIPLLPSITYKNNAFLMGVSLNVYFILFLVFV